MKKIIGFNFSEFDPIFKYSQKLVYPDNKLAREEYIKLI